MKKVLFEVTQPGIGKITLNDSDCLNAMGEEMADDFKEVSDSIPGKDIKVLVLTGAGRAFSAGGDLEMLRAKQNLSAQENEQKMLEFYDSFLRILKHNIPMVAAINGHAVGAGLCLASACDVRIASKEAKLGFSFVKLGLHPGMGATYFLPKLVGPKAAELLLTGCVMEADEAYACGLISEVVETGEVLPRALELSSLIADCGSLAIRQLTETLRRGTSSLSESLGREASCQGENYISEEFGERLEKTVKNIRSK